MGSNANSAEGAEGKMEEINLSSKDPKDPSGEEAVLETLVSEEDAGNGRNVEFLESMADGSRKATNAEIKKHLGRQSMGCGRAERSTAGDRAAHTLEMRYFWFGKTSSVFYRR